MEEKKISPEESLQIIEQMLAETRNRFYYNGFSFLFWGVFIILDCITGYLMHLMGHENKMLYVWFSNPVIAIFYAIIVWYRSKNNSPKNNSSRLDYFNGMIWGAFGISSFVMLFICFQLKITMGPFVLCMMGMGMFASGAIYRFSWLYAGAAVFWLGSIIIAVLGDSAINYLVVAATLFFGYIIPGFLLWKKAKKEAYV